MISKTLEELGREMQMLARELKTLVYEIKILAYEGVVIWDNQKHKIETYCKIEDND